MADTDPHVYFVVSYAHPRDGNSWTLVQISSLKGLDYKDRTSDCERGGVTIRIKIGVAYWDMLGNM